LLISYSNHLPYVADSWFCVSSPAFSSVFGPTRHIERTVSRPVLLHPMRRQWLPTSVCKEWSTWYSSYLFIVGF